MCVGYIHLYIYLSTYPSIYLSIYTAHSLLLPGNHNDSAHTSSAGGSGGFDVIHNISTVACHVTGREAGGFSWHSYVVIIDMPSMYVWAKAGHCAYLYRYTCAFLKDVPKLHLKFSI